MNTQVVRHKSRIVTEDFQFTANGETSWSFIAEGDGEIYDVVSNNIASYTINGDAVSLPFSLTDGNSYTVAIVKTTGGQVADIQFKTRRAIDKTKSINVPDFSAGDASKLYLIHPDSISILDNSDIINSSVVTVTLPTLPSSDYSWQSACWLVDNRLIVSASTNGISDRFLAACFVDLSDNSVSDFDGNLNQYTQINAAGGAGNKYEWIDYDYVNGLIYLREGSVSNYCFEIDVINKVNNGLIPLEYGAVLFQNRGSNNAYFDPIKNAFVGLMYYRFDTNKTDTIAYVNNATVDAVFDRVLGYKIKRDNNNDGRTYAFNREGTLVKAISINIGSGTLVGWTYDLNNKRGTTINRKDGSTNVLINVKLDDWNDFLTTNYKLYDSIDSGVPIGLHNLWRSYYSGLSSIVYVLARDTTEVNNGYIVLIDNSKLDAGDVTPIVGTYIGTNPINGITSNRIL